MREDISQVLRSQLVILTKVNNANAVTLQFFREYLAANKHPVIEAKAHSVVNTENKKLFLYSGIGNPAQLKSNLEKSGFTVVQHLVFADHHGYSLSEQSDIMTQWRSQFADSVLCATEKDLVKITDTDLKSQTKAISLQLEFSSQDKDLLHAKLSQICK